MAYKILKTDSYQRDLDGVVGYIALSLVNKTAAVSLLDAVEKVYDDLERSYTCGYLHLSLVQVFVRTPAAAISFANFNSF